MWKWIKALNPFAVQLRNTEARLEFARVLLAQAEIELADKAFYVREFAAVSQERDALKERNDVQAEQLRLIDGQVSPLMSEVAALKAQLRRGKDHNQTITEGYKAEIAALRERASVPVPAGVPSVEELAEIGWQANRNYVVHEDAATAIRDAVLAGVAPLSTIQRMTENQGYSTAPPAMPTPLPATIEVLDFDQPADQVEALARVLRDSYCKHYGITAKGELPSHYMDHARAAIAHLAKRPEGMPTAEELRAAHMKYVEGYRKGENNGSMCATDFALEYLTPYIHMPMKANL